MAMWIFLLGIGLAFMAAVSSEAFIEAQDPSMKGETNVKRSHNVCSTHCPQGWYCDHRARLCKVCVNSKCGKRCDDHNQCQQGYYCASGMCQEIPGYCTSDSSCSDSQCCAKLYSSQTGGLCRELKKPNEWCPTKNYHGFHCGCTDGYKCKPHYFYWGKCVVKPTPKPTTKPTTKPTPKPPPRCSSDDSCQKSHCCSGGTCKQRKKADEWCPHKGADLYNCGCIEGYFCKIYEDNEYWGNCEQEEPGSGLEA